MSSPTEVAYQTAAQKVREARMTLSNIENKSFGDYVLLLVLAVIEESLTYKHSPDEDQ